MNNLKIIILITPFQLDQLVRISKQYSIDFDSSVYYISGFITEELVRKKLSLKSSSIYTIPEFNASLSRIIKSPFREIGLHRKHIHQIKVFIDETLSKHSSEIELWIGTEKDLFTQILMGKLKSKAGKYPLKSFEEGLGYYSKISTKDRVLKFIYPFVTPVLFGIQYDYFKCLGTHKDIQEIYVRFPEEIPYKNKKAVYHRIEPSKAPSNSIAEKDFLFFSAPLSESSLCTLEEERELFNGIIQTLEDAQMKVDIKAHPRENVDKFLPFASENMHILAHDFSGEDLDYFKYKHIINLGSSIILDIHQRKYPLESVITLNMEYNFQVFTNALFDRGVHLRLFDKDLEHKFKKAINSLKNV